MIRILLVVVALVGATQPAAPWQPLFERVQPDLFAAPGGQASAWADDSGSGYCSQNAIPSHLGVPDTWKGRVDVSLGLSWCPEAVWPRRVT